MDFVPERFRDYVREKFADWRGKGRDTLVDYAAYIGVSQQVMSNWYNGKLKRRPDPETYGRLVEKYRYEVYDYLCLPRPESSSSKIPPALRAQIDSAVAELTSKITAKGMDPESPAAIAIALEVLARHGLNWKIIVREENSSDDV